MNKRKTVALNEIRLFEDGHRNVRVECPQSLLVSLLHFLDSKGFKCGIARISSQDNINRTQSIVSFGVDDHAQEEIKYAVRVFLSVAKVKFTENSDRAETVFQLVSKITRR